MSLFSRDVQRSSGFPLVLGLDIDPFAGSSRTTASWPFAGRKVKSHEASLIFPIDISLVLYEEVSDKEVVKV